MDDLLSDVVGRQGSVGMVILGLRETPASMSSPRRLEQTRCLLGGRRSWGSHAGMSQLLGQAPGQVLVGVRRRDTEGQHDLGEGRSAASERPVDVECEQKWAQTALVDASDGRVQTQGVLAVHDHFREFRSAL